MAVATKSTGLKMVVTCTFETSVTFQRTTLRYMPIHITLHNDRRENLK
jgi:hypothetical protein